MDVAEVIKIQNQIASKIEELRGRIGTHRGYLTGSEPRTRQLLIDPMLRVLEWDIENPEQVHLEYPVSGGRVDYALMSSGRVVVVIEAKVLGKNLDNLGPGQLLKYAKDPDMQQLKLVVITDGDTWIIYSMESTSEKVFRISQLQPLESAQIAVDLWEQNITVTDSGDTGLSVVSIEEDPITERGTGDEQVTQAPPQSGPTNHPPTSGTETGWIPLNKLDPEWHRPSPKAVRFEDSPEVEVELQKEFFTEVVSWLARETDPEDWHKLPEGPNNVISSDENKFKLPGREQLPNGMYLQTSRGWEVKVDVLKKLFSYFKDYGLDSVYVKFDQPPVYKDGTPWHDS